MQQSKMVLAAVLAVVALSVVSCSSESSSSSDTTTTVAPRSTPGCKSKDNTSTQRMTVEPCDGLTNGQVVKVYGSNFTPGKTVAVNICSADTNNAGDGCDLGALKPGEVGTGGSLVIDYAVEQVLNSKDPVDCATKQCVLSLGELVAGDAERADSVEIEFAP